MLEQELVDEEIEVDEDEQEELNLNKIKGSSCAGRTRKR